MIPDPKPRLRKDHSSEYKLRSILAKTIKKNACLEWTGNYFYRLNGTKSYPYMYFKNKVWRGNRLVMFLSSGKLPKTMYALHKCDNQKCVNPKHLYWGTAKQNVRDAYRSGNAHTLRNKKGQYEKLP